MGNRIIGFTVVFEENVSEQYMDAVKQSIMLMSGTAKIEPVIQDSSSFVATSQERFRISRALIDFIETDFKEKK